MKVEMILAVNEDFGENRWPDRASRCGSLHVTWFREGFKEALGKIEEIKRCNVSEEWDRL